MKWRATVGRRHVGAFDTPEEAYEARRKHQRSKKLPVDPPLPVARAEASPIHARSSSHVGVAFFKNSAKWQAHHHGNKYIGLFLTEAHAAYAIEVVKQKLASGASLPDALLAGKTCAAPAES